MMGQGHGARRGDLEERPATVEFCDEAPIVTSLDGTIRTWSATVEAMLGYAPHEAAGRHLSFLAPPECVSELRWRLERAGQGEDARQETVFVAKSGEPVEVALILSPIRDRSGSLSGIGVLARDMTEPHWLAQTLDSTTAALQAALDEARESETLARRLMADAAHQLRSPIAGAQACAQALLATESPPERDRLLTAIVRESERAGKLISNLLRLARLDQGEAPVRQPWDVVAVFGEEVERTRTLAPHLHVELCADLHDRALLDPDAMREILGNLMENARRHARCSIQLEAAVVDGCLEIRVVDDGPGLPEGQEEHAFERFVSFDGKGGSGLGLAIARDLSRAHGGDLVYDRSVGAFVLRLPVPPASGGGHGGAEGDYGSLDIGGSEIVSPMVK